MQADGLLAVLPRTECGQCGYAGCRPYAAALSVGQATPDACIPGGAYVRDRLQQLLNLPRSPARDVLLAPLPPPLRARIDEDLCIGCTKCLDACPVDAIVGAAHQLHGILHDACTGCGLCMPPCPVDCITLLPAHAPDAWPHAGSPQARKLNDAVAAPCTNCGACAPACPVALNPAALYQELEKCEFTAAQAAGLARCTECAACDEVCPSRIPLSAWFGQAQGVVAALAEARDSAAAAASRVEAHAARCARTPPDAPSALLPDLSEIAGAPAAREVAGAVTRAQRAAAQPVPAS